MDPALSHALVGLCSALVGALPAFYGARWKGRTELERTQVELQEAQAAARLSDSQAMATFRDQLMADIGGLREELTRASGELDRHRDDLMECRRQCAHCEGLHQAAEREIQTLRTQLDELRRIMPKRSTDPERNGG